MTGLICAVDFSDKAQSDQLIDQIANDIDVIKLGLEFFTSHSLNDIEKIREKAPLFIDLKLHDIPNTVAKAVKNLLKYDPALLTIHTSGGPAMLEAAANEVAKANSNTQILGVTVLTSISNDQFSQIGFQNTLEEQVVQLSQMSYNCGVKGIVCSPHEAILLRQKLNTDLTLVCPGIRMDNNAQDDQSRVMTPQKAAQNKINYIVVGRPITQASNPLLTVQEIKKQMIIK